MAGLSVIQKYELLAAHKPAPQISPIYVPLPLLGSQADSMEPAGTKRDVNSQ